MSEIKNGRYLACMAKCNNLKKWALKGYIPAYKILDFSLDWIRAFIVSSLASCTDPPPCLHVASRTPKAAGL